MKKLIAIALVLSSAIEAHALTARTRVVVREPDFDAVIRTETLTDLTVAGRLEGTYFKVVDGKADEAIRLDNPDTELVLRAATAYYHLTKAREWFVRNTAATHVRSLPQMIIRVNIKNQFNEMGQFAHDEVAQQFNNALTIPPGQSPDFVPPAERRTWNTEIWFRPAKQIDIAELNLRDPALGEWGGVLSAYRQQAHMQTLARFLSSSALEATGRSGTYFETENLIRVAGTALLLEAVYRWGDPIARFFSRRHFHLDSALVPEIIYHEYAHVALSDHLVLSHSSAVIEGMADYFAGRIANSPRLATNIEDYNTFNGKRANQRRMQTYRVQFETTDWANADFVFGMLWDLQSIIGQGQATDRFVYALRERLETSNTIRGQFVEGVLSTCDQLCTDRFNQRVRILQRYDRRGL